MSWTIAKEKLLSTLNILNLVPILSGITSSEFLRIENNGKSTIWSIAGLAVGRAQIQGVGEWPCKKIFYINRKSLLPFLQSSRSKADFDFSYEKKTLLLRHGKRKARFYIQPEIAGYGFNDKEKAKTLHLTEQNIDLLQAARRCASDNPMKPQINCVFMQNNGKNSDIFASNEKLVFWAQSSNKKMQNNSVIFPLSLVDLLTQEKLQNVYNGKNHMQLQFPHVSILHPIVKKARLNFPADSSRKIFKNSQKFPVLFQADSVKFFSVLDRMAVCLSSIRKEDWMLQLRGSKQKQELLLKTILPSSVFSERIKMKIHHDFSLNWPLNDIMLMLQYLKDRKLSLQVREGKQCCYLESKNIRLAIAKLQN